MWPPAILILIARDGTEQPAPWCACDCRYKASEGEDAVSETHFMSMWRTHPLLAHVQMARKIRNFQLCTTCHRINEGITAAHKAHKTTELEKWRKIRREHHELQQGERLSYYKRRREGTSDLSGEEHLLHHSRQVGLGQDDGAVLGT